jgi:DnaJ homolog subfamily C member 19
LLGVGERATLQEIRDAHRRLIARVHPDAGGSAELAIRVNAARDALIAELNRPRAS